MKYIEYGEYTEIGGMLDLTAFNKNIMRACLLIDTVTHNRIENMKQVPLEAKLCCRDLVDYWDKNSFSADVSSKSQSAGNVSESVTYKDKSTEAVYSEVDNIICDYLLNVKDDNGTPILYRGLNV